MEPIERELLEAVAQDAHGSDRRAALIVLADYWIQRGEVDRGTLVQLQCGELARDRAEELAAQLAPQQARWTAPLLEAGFARADLRFEHGLLRAPVVIDDGDPLDGTPELFRMSPRYYRAHETTPRGTIRMIEAELVTPMAAGPGRRVAIKCPEPGERMVPAWLEREHAILSRIRHPNVSALVGRAITRTGPGLVVGWAGLSLKQLLDLAGDRRRDLGAGFAVSVAVQLCAALEACHRAGACHGDLKPEHVMIGGDGAVTLIDFSDADALEPKVRRFGGATSTGIMSPGPDSFRYRAPEQIRGIELDARSDLFSTVVVTCELIAGEHPIRGPGNNFDLLRAISDYHHELPRVPGPIAAVLQRGLAHPNRRFTSATELRAALIEAAETTALALGPEQVAQALRQLRIST